jgi:hypothetical protein
MDDRVVEVKLPPGGDIEYDLMVGAGGTVTEGEAEENADGDQE